MEAVRWLKQFAPGFDQLSVQERKAIKDFAFLWSLYVGTVLDTRGSAGAIVQSVQRLNDRMPLDLTPIQHAVAYFKNRYYQNGQYTPEYDGLHLRGPTDREPLVRSVLNGNAVDAVEVLAGVLIVVLRYRNNLFHGIKWEYRLAGQRQNFRMANDVLMHVMTLPR